MNEPLPLRELHIRPAADVPPGIPECLRGPSGAVLVFGEKAGVFAKTLARESRAAESGNEAPARGQKYGLWHRFLPYRIKRFADDREARLFAMTHGYTLDGILNG